MKMALTDLCRKKFNKFTNSNIEIFAQYNKNFKFPKCFYDEKSCRCFSPKLDVFFSFEFPLSYINILKKHLRKQISEIEKHNNILIVNLSPKANLVKRQKIKNSAKDHKKSLEAFESFFDQQKIMSRLKNSEFFSYIEGQKEKCFDLISEVCFWEYEEFVPLIILKTSLYAHYHTIKMFENFVNKKH